MTNLTILTSFILLLLSCTNSTKETVLNAKDTQSKKFISTWTSVKRPYPFRADLSINADYTFTYKGGACEALMTSIGNWAVIADTLVLNSEKPDECYRLTEFGVNCILFDSLNAKKPVENTKACVSLDEKFFVTFTNEKFFVSSDTLSHKANINDVCSIEISHNFTLKK